MSKGLFVKHQLVERVESRSAAQQLLGGGNRSVHEDLPAGGPVREAQLLVGAKEVHLVRAGHRASTQRVHANLALRARADHSLAAMGHRDLAGRINTSAQHLGRTGRRVGLLVVMRLDDLDVPAGRRRPPSRSRMVVKPSPSFYPSDTVATLTHGQKTTHCKREFMYYYGCLFYGWGSSLGIGGGNLGMKSSHLAPAVQFGLWFFAFMLLESFVNSSFVALLGAEAVNAAYSVGIICTASGLLAFGLAHAKHKAWCKSLVPAAAVVCSAAAIGMAYAHHTFPLAVFSCVALLACGFVGGKAHLGIALEYGEGPTCGRMIGAAAGCAVCVQFLVQNFTQGQIPTLACILASMVVLLLHARRRHSDLPTHVASDMWARTWPSDPADRHRHGIFLVVSAAILTVIFSLNDAVVVALDASGSMTLFSGIRLYYALGLVVAGCLFDLTPRPSFTFSTVAVQMLAVLVPYFLGTPEWYSLNMALFYFYGGFYVVFITAEFVAFSGQMSNSALWAGLGRTTRSYVTGLSVIPISLLYAAFGVISLVALGIALNMALLAVCALDALLLTRYRLPEQQASTCGDQKAAVSDFDERNLEQFAQELGLTDREREVLSLMVTTEDENQKMANDLDISRRTLQRHIAHVYEKAGVQSRIGLYKVVVAYAAAQRG